MISRFSPNYDYSEFFLAFKKSSSDARDKLEREFCKVTKSKRAFAFRYGRSGLYFLLKALNSKNKNVILPAYTCVTVAHAIVRAGYVPVFLDNEKGEFQPHPQRYFDAIDDKTAMIMPTHLFGMTQETADLFQNIKKYFPNVFILQDCAHSFFSCDESAKLPTSLGDGAIFGMNISKLLNSVKGGMLTLNDHKVELELSKILKNEMKWQSLLSMVFSRIYVLVATIAFTPLFYRVVLWLQRNTKILSSETNYYSEETIELPKDFDQQMSNFESEIGIRSLIKYPTRIEQRKEISKFYMTNLKSLEKKGVVKLPPFKEGFSWSHFPVLVSPAIRKDIISQCRLNAGVEIGVIVDYTIPEMKSYKDMKKRDFPNAIEIEKSIINLPLTYKESLTRNIDWQKRAQKVVNVLLSFEHSSQYSRGKET